MNKWAETDAWRVRWALHGQRSVLPWSLLISIPATVLDEHVARPMSRCYESFRDASHTVWVLAFYRQNRRGYRLQLHSPRAQEVAAAVGVLAYHYEIMVLRWLGSFSGSVLTYESGRFGPIRQILQQLPEPPW